MTYNEAISLLDSLTFLTSYDINYGREYHFGIGETFTIRVIKTFLHEGYAVSYCISHYIGDFYFEDFYERMPQKMQENVMFNINTFQKLNAGQCSESERQDIIGWVEIMNEQYKEEFDNLIGE
jgi:hypothetical protein